MCGYLLNQGIHLSDAGNDSDKLKLISKFKGVKVYKYKNFNIKQFKDIMAGNLYFSNAAFLNNILDSRIKLAEVSRAVATTDKLKISIDKDNYYFSLSYLNPLSINSHFMWGVYAANGMGYAIEYDLGELLQSLWFKEPKDTISDKDSVFNGTQDFLFELAEVRYEANWNPLDNLSKLARSNLPHHLYKDSGFKREAELKVIASHKLEHPDYRNHNGVKFAPKAWPSKIYFGWNLDISEVITQPDNVQFVQLNGKLNFEKREFLVG